MRFKKDMLYSYKSDTREALFEKILNQVTVVDTGCETPCWVWTGGTSGETGRGKGYGRMCANGQTAAVHRVMWSLVHGFLPAKNQIDHKCQTRLCCNPDHLERVTHKTNQRRRRTHGRGKVYAL